MYFEVPKIFSGKCYKISNSLTLLFCRNQNKPHSKLLHHSSFFQIPITLVDFLDSPMTFLKRPRCYFGNAVPTWRFAKPNDFDRPPLFMNLREGFQPVSDKMTGHVSYKKHNCGQNEMRTLNELATFNEKLLKSHTMDLSNLSVRFPRFHYVREFHCVDLFYWKTVTEVSEGAEVWFAAI